MSVRTSLRTDPFLRNEVPTTVESATEAAAAMTAGVAAITDVIVQRDEKWSTVTFTAWFDDINRVRLGPRAPHVEEFAWSRQGDGYALEIRPVGIAEVVASELGWAKRIAKAPAGEQPTLRDEHEEWLAGLWGLDLRTEVQLPGEVSSVEGLEKVDARTVSVHVTPTDLTDPARLALLAAGLRARCGASVMTAEELEKFRADLAAARTAWARSPWSAVISARPDRTIDRTECGWIERFLGRNRFATTDEFNGVTIRDVKGKAISRFPNDLPFPQLLDAPDGNRVYVVSSSGQTIAAHDVATGKRQWKVAGPGADRPWEDWRVCVLPTGRIVVAKLETIDVLEGATGRRVRSFPDPGELSTPYPLGTPDAILLRNRDSLTAVSAVGAPLWRVAPTFAGRPCSVRAVEVATKTNTVVAVFGNEAVEETVTVALDGETGREMHRIRVSGEYLQLSRGGRFALVERGLRPMVVDVLRGVRLGWLDLPGALASRRMTFGWDDGTLWVYPGPVGTERNTFRSFVLDAPADGAPAGPPKER